MIISGPGTIQVNPSTGEKVLAGVAVSMTGLPCGSIDQYTLYVSVYAHKRWIRNIIGTV